MRQITIFSREACHLCDEMRAQVTRLCADRDVLIETVDVDSDVALARRFGPFVPVLVVDGEELCHYRLDVEALKRSLIG